MSRWISFLERLGDKALITTFPPKSRPDLERIGSDYGGRSIPTSLIDGGSICYCAGVGEDTSFDEALIERFGCVVFAFDPTPRAVEHAEEVAGRNRRFRFYPVGVAGRDGPRRFFAPANSTWVSHSIVNLGGTSEWFEADCFRISTLIQRLGHSRIDLVKLDIEGAQYGVIADMLVRGVLPTVLCVEFDQPTPRRKVWLTLFALRIVGYGVVARDWWDFTLVRSRALKFSFRRS